MNLFYFFCFLIFCIQRTTSENHVLHVLMVLDNAVRERWENLKRETPNRPPLEEIYSSVFELVKKRFDQVSFGSHQFELKLSQLFIAKSLRDSEYTEVNEAKIDSWSLGTYQVLETFTKWVQTNKQKLTKHHVAILVSGYKLLELTGASHVASLCKENPVGVVQEGGQFEVVDQISHEIGHILGSQDDEINNDCRITDQNIMASARMESPITQSYLTFSRCSKESIAKHLDEIHRNKTSCFKKPNQVQVLKTNKFREGLVGKKIKIDDQCKIYFGLKSFHCGGGGEFQSQLCYRMECWDPKSKECKRVARQIPDNGTPCGSQKWCLDGTCVQDSRAPKLSSDYCIHGDFKGFIDLYYSQTSCEEMGRTTSMYCYTEPYRGICCNTCAKLKKKFQDIKSCEYGNKAEGCKLLSCSDRRNQCCGTCSYLHRAPQKKDEPWCESLKLHQCYSFDVPCKQKCKPYHRKGTKDCYYGDKEEWCETLLASDKNLCKFSVISSVCCYSCSNKSGK